MFELANEEIKSEWTYCLKLSISRTLNVVFRNSRKVAGINIKSLLNDDY